MNISLKFIQCFYFIFLFDHTVVITLDFFCKKLFKRKNHKDNDI